jgi:hypothetical protein
MNPTRDPARVGIQSDPEHFSGSRVGILPLQEPPTQDPEALDPDLGWIPTRVSGISSTGNLFQQAAAGSQTRCAGLQRPTSAASRATPLLGGVLRWCTPGGLPDIWGALPRRRAGSRTPSPGWADTARHLGTSPLLAVPSFLLRMSRVFLVAAAAQLMRVSSGGLPDIWGALLGRRAGSRTPLPGWADTARHLGYLRRHIHTQQR